MTHARPALVLVAFLVAGCGTAGSPSPVPTATAPPSTAPPTATSSAPPSATPVPTATATPTPSASPTPDDGGPSPSGLACVTLPYSRPSNAVAVPLVTVRAASHPGYDRVVWEFGGTGWPAVAMAMASPPFTKDPSDLPLTVAGTVFLRVVLTGLDTAYDGPQDLPVALPEIREVAMQGHFEGVGSWIVGLASPPCVTVFTLTGPNRLVVDVAVSP